MNRDGNQETERQDRAESSESLEEYAGGDVKSRHGRVNAWLLIVYLVLFLWALYYGYTYWGGLGPGLDY